MKRSKRKEQRFSVRKAAGAMAAVLALSPAVGAVTAVAAGSPVFSNEILNQLMIKGGTPHTLDLSEFFSDPDEGDTLSYSINSLDPESPGIAGVGITDGTFLQITPGTVASPDYYSYKIAATDTVGNVTYSNPFTVRTASSPVGGSEPVIKYRYISNGYTKILNPTIPNVFADEDSSELTVTVSPPSDGLYSSQSANWNGESLQPFFIINKTGTETVTLTARDNDYREDGTGTAEAVSLLTLDVIENREPQKKISEAAVAVTANPAGGAIIDLSEYFDDADLAEDFINEEVLGYQLSYDSGSVYARENGHLLNVSGVSPGQTVPVMVSAIDNGGLISEPITFNLTIEPAIIVRVNGEAPEAPIVNKQSELSIQVIPPAGFAPENVYLRPSEVIVGAAETPGQDIVVPLYEGGAYGGIEASDIPVGEYWLYTLDSDGKVNMVSKPFLVADLAALKPQFDLNGDEKIEIGDIVKLQSLTDAGFSDVTKDGNYDRRDMRYLLTLIGSSSRPGSQEGGV
ncbi:hypothetical protein [Paenibacillus contaminans]|uniref:Uncharacterized protein n=1 Tax=Paenibacillus contaminans TaxID=450362 RepID=A0A329LWY9_9BACL|nr:hypothetical protein [Paenibacillus contaminans]RAV12485.1 hypothetical protein DQG23_34720 [Paenibacillus contaminans]